MFAFFEYLVSTNIFEEIFLSRGPVGNINILIFLSSNYRTKIGFYLSSYSGNTHEDIDGLFGVVRRYLSTRSWRTYEELQQHIRDAFAQLSLRIPVIVRFLPATLNFSDWLQPCIDSRLSNFSRQHENFNPGMHALWYEYMHFCVCTFSEVSCRSFCRIRRGETAGSTVCSFRMYQSPKFSTVVFSAQELHYWVQGAVPRTPFFPTLVHIESEFNRHTILVSKPVGSPALAARKPDWLISLGKALRDCHADLPGEANVQAREWWSHFIGRIGAGNQVSSGLYVLPDQTFSDIEASFARFFPIPWALFVEPLGAAAARAAGQTAPHRNTVNSSILRSERRAPSS